MLPNEKMELIEKLKQKTAYALRSEFADEALTEEHCIASHVPNLNTLRVIRSKSQCPENKENAVCSLYESQKIYVDCIQRIDFFPFATFYSTPSQRAWYKKEFERNKRSTISIDASGVGVQSPTDFKKYFFLYIIICAQGK